RPVTAEVVSSSLIWVVYRLLSEVCIILWGLSSAGRASALQAEGHRFEPYRPHFCIRKRKVFWHFPLFNFKRRDYVRTILYRQPCDTVCLKTGEESGYCFG